MGRLFGSWVLCALAAVLAAAPLSAQSLLEGQFDSAIPTLEQAVGHVPGTRITAPDQIVDYLEALQAAAPDRLRLVTYATSWEGRPLVYAVISAPANMARLDEIKAATAVLASGAPGADVAGALGRTLPVTWLGYGVHGDEISSSDAALVLAYHLLASQGDERVDTILRNSVVIIDPSQNPDGRARFVQHYREAAGIVPFANRYAAEHDQRWPGGRFNHYLFDLNRDWFALTQPETQGKVAAVREWQPVVLVDAHEMGGDSSFFFPPSADPFNPNIPQAQREKQVLLGRNHAAWFDRLGVPYFTREVFDAFYPGYGDTWPTLNGSIAMTFEQASASGLVFERTDGERLTYRDAVRNHFVATLSTAETVARNAQLFLRDYAAYRRDAASGAAGRGTYVIDLGQRRWNAEALGRRLAAQGIAVRRFDGPASACGRSYPQGLLAIDRAQPAARLVRSLLDEETPLPADFMAEQEARRGRDLPHELYDVTAWSVSMMSGLDATLCSAAVMGTPLSAEQPIPGRVAAAGTFGVAVPWSDSGQARLVAAALSAGIVGRATEKAFTAEGRAFPRGTVIFTRADNGGDKLDRLAGLARGIGAETVALASGWVDSGPNLGSDNFFRLAMPRVAMVWDDGVQPQSAGSVKYVLEQRLGVPVAPIRTGTISEADLADFDVLIIPQGNPADQLGEDGRERIARFAADGGVVVAIGDSILTLSQGDQPLLKTRRETALGGKPEEEESDEDEGDAPSVAPGQEIASEDDYRKAITDSDAAPDELPGALVRTLADPDSFLSAGYDSGPIALASGELVFQPLNRGDGTNVIRFAAPDRLVASGYVWDENRRQLAFKPYMMAQPNGRGLAIGFTQDPTARGYLDGLDLLLANAVILAPARIR